MFVVPSADRVIRKPLKHALHISLHISHTCTVDEHRALTAYDDDAPALEVATVLTFCAKKKRSLRVYLRAPFLSDSLSLSLSLSPRAFSSHNFVFYYIWSLLPDFVVGLPLP